MSEEIRGVTWGLDGPELEPWQAAQRLYKAGFTDAKELVTMWAVLEAESGGYLRAWHHNVERNPDKTIKRYPGNKMRIKSTDLGFIQRNVLHPQPIEVDLDDPAASQAVVERLFHNNPALANGQLSAEMARKLFEARGFQPWYAHTNGSYKRSLPRGIEATANFLGRVMLNEDKLVERLDA